LAVSGRTEQGEEASMKSMVTLVELGEALAQPCLELRIHNVLYEFVGREASTENLAELKVAVAHAIDDWASSGCLELWQHPPL
jgi:hypothetical protein